MASYNIFQEVSLRCTQNCFQNVLFYCIYDIILWVIDLNLVTVEHKPFKIMWKQQDNCEPKGKTEKNKLK